MADYSFLTLWQLDAPLERVWETISDVDSYPLWWKYVAKVEEVRPGDSQGIGAVYRYHWTTALPYDLQFEVSTTRVEPPHLYEGQAVGELAGFGRWELEAADPGTNVRYTWNVATTKPWMNLVAPLARPLFARNHAIIMREGGEGLARYLGARLVQNVPQVPAETDTGPQLAPAVGVGLAAIAGAITYRWLRARQP